MTGRRGADDGALFPARWWWTLLDLVIAAFIASVAVQYRSDSPAAVVIGLVMAAGLLVIWAMTDIGDVWRGTALFGVVVGVCAVIWLVSLVLRLRKDAGEAMADRSATAERERDHLVLLATAAERAGRTTWWRTASR